MQVLPACCILDVDILGLVVACVCCVSTSCVSLGRLFFIVLCCTAVFAVNVAGFIVDNACFLTAALTFQTVVEYDLAVILSVAHRQTELINLFTADCII